MAGRRIFIKRYELRAFSKQFRGAVDVDPSLSSYKTTEVHITREPAPIPVKIAVDLHPPMDAGEIEAVGRGYDQYTVTIASDPVSRPALAASQSNDAFLYRQHSAALEANTAAWGYTKIALLFFISLLVTWVSAKSRVPARIEGVCPSGKELARLLTARPAGPFLGEPCLLAHLSGPRVDALHLRLERRAPLDGLLELPHLHHHLMGGLQAPLRQYVGFHPGPGTARFTSGPRPNVKHKHEPTFVHYVRAET